MYVYTGACVDLAHALPMHDTVVTVYISLGTYMRGCNVREYRGNGNINDHVYARERNRKRAFEFVNQNKLNRAIKNNRAVPITYTLHLSVTLWELTIYSFKIFAFKRRKRIRRSLPR